MKQKEDNLGTLTDLVEKIDGVQIEIDCILSLMDFDEDVHDPGEETEGGAKIKQIINRFSEVYRGNRDKFVLKMISVLESME